MLDETQQLKIDRREFWALASLNFFMADMQAGIGPFLGIFLLAHSWNAGMIGTVMTLGGVAGMLVTAPAGAFVDSSTHKRSYVIFSGIATLVASGLIFISQKFWVIAFAQIASALAAAAIGPAVTGITLGIVQQKAFNRQNGTNQAYNHAGNMVGAALSGYLGWKFGFIAVFGLAALFGLMSIFSTLLIRRKKINDRAARGLTGGESAEDKVSGLATLVSCKPLLILAAALAFFHLGNGAMLPLFGMAVVSIQKSGNGSAFVALTIVIAQFTMVLASLFATQFVEKRGYWTILFISFLALPIRGLIAANWMSHSGVYPVQILDGIGAGLQSVAVPGLVARILNGTGRVNVGQGAIMSVQGLGASLSPALGAWVAQYFGYPTSFMTLGGFALFSIAIWCTTRSTYRSL